MSCYRAAALAITAIIAVVAEVSPVAAQGDSSQERFYVGRVALSPTIRLTNGWDSNVYNLNRESDEISDVTLMLSPVIDAAVRSPRFRLTAHSQWDYYYFRRQTALRALDIDQSGRVEATLNRLSPYLSGSWMTTRHRQNLEIDAMVRRQNHSLEGGTYVRMSAKTFIGLAAARSVVDYEGGAQFRGTELARALDHSRVRGTLSLQYQATPLTTFSVGVSRTQNRFAASRERESDSWQIGPTVEFKPLALISGSASVGFQKVKFRDRTQPDFKSTVATVNLQYTLRGRTQFGVSAERNLEYSYLDTQVDYVLAGLTSTVTHRLNERWDVGTVIGRYGLGYRRREVQANVEAIPSSTFMNYGTNLGYRFGRHRIGFDVEYHHRTSDTPVHEYERFRVGSSLSYVF